MAEKRVPTRTEIFYESPNVFRICTYYAQNDECFNYIYHFRILTTDEAGVGQQGDLLVSYEYGTPDVDAWLDEDGNLIIMDYLGNNYSLSVNGDVIFNC
jgi:hypothetical protein